MKRSLFSTLFAALLVLLCLTVMPRETLAAEEVYSGTCGENVKWELSQGTLTISGYGPMSSYAIASKYPWSGHSSSIHTVVIGGGVTSIGTSAFYNYSDMTGVCYDNLTTVILPESLTVINSGAFYNCYNLKDINLPESVTSIGGFAFIGCSSLTEITLPANLQSLGSYAFEGCTSLTSVVIPGTVRGLGKEVFRDCTSLRNVTIAEGVVSIGVSAFRNCVSLTSLSLPDTIVEIGGSAFYECSNLSSIKLPAGLTEIQDSVFWKCSSLTEVDVPANVTSIGSYAFYRCGSLANVNLRNGLVSIGNNTFDCCTNLANIDLPNSLRSIGMNTFAGCVKLTEVVLPDGLTTIGNYAFGGCIGLSRVDLPASLTFLGEAAFKDCAKLEYVSFPDSELTVENDLFERTMVSTLVFQGNPPAFSERTFAYITADAYYPSDNTAWTEGFLQNYYGTITWKPHQYAAIVQQPQHAMSHVGCTVFTSVTASGDGLTYQWYYANKGSNVFTYTKSFSTNVYALTMNASRDGRRVYCVITDMYGNSVKSNVATLSMDLSAYITSQPVSVAVASGQTAKIAVGVRGDGLTYKWYYANKGSDTFTYTKSFSTNVYSVSMNSARNGRRVYCVITDKYGNSVTTDTVTLSMKTPLKLISQPVDAIVGPGDVAKVTVRVQGEGLSFKWYYANAGSDSFTYTKAFGGNSYSVSMTAARSGRRVYCVITDKYGDSVTSNIVTIGTIKLISQPTSVAVAAGAQAKVTVNVRGEGLTFQWYYSDGGDFKLTTAFRSNSYTITMNEARNGRRLYCIVTDQYGNTVKTDEVTISMK